MADPGSFPTIDPDVPQTLLDATNAALKFQFMVGEPTFSIIISNAGSVPLRVYFKNPAIVAGVYNNDYFDIAAGEKIEGQYDITDLWLMGVGGTCAFQLLIDHRVT